MLQVTKRDIRVDVFLQILEKEKAKVSGLDWYKISAGIDFMDLSAIYFSNTYK